MTDDELKAATDDELVGKMVLAARSLMTGDKARPSDSKDRMALALAIAKPEIERALLQSVIERGDKCKKEFSALVRIVARSVAKERGIDLADPTVPEDHIPTGRW